RCVLNEFVITTFYQTSPHTLLLPLYPYTTLFRSKVLWWTPLLAAATLLPAVVSHKTDLRAIFADPGAPAGFDPAPAWQMLLGLPHDTMFDTGLAELPWLDFASASLPWTGIFIGVVTGPLLVAAIIGAIAPGI